jgi:hypothetical protein
MTIRNLLYRNLERIFKRNQETQYNQDGKDYFNLDEDIAKQTGLVAYSYNKRE